MKALLLGAGQLGSRHLQGLAVVPEIESIYVVEPNRAAREIATQRWRAATVDLRKRLEFISYEELLGFNDFAVAVIATQSTGRLSALQQVLALGVRNILCEKVAFQSQAEYRQAVQCVSVERAHAYLNYVYRYCDAYQTLKKFASGRGIFLEVSAGDNGLGCNLIHFLDLLEYLSGNRVKEVKVWLDRPFRQNKRDSQLLEFSGTAEASTDSGARLLVRFSRGEQKPPRCRLHLDGKRVVVDESERAISSEIPELDGLDFTLPMVSSLTARVIPEMLFGDTVLPTLGESLVANTRMLSALNLEVFGFDDESMKCPIT